MVRRQFLPQRILCYHHVWSYICSNTCGEKKYVDKNAENFKQQVSFYFANLSVLVCFSSHVL